MYIFILIWLLFCLKKMRNDNLLHLIIAMIPVFILIAFRDESVGIDTRGYLNMMESIKEFDSLSQLFEVFNLEKGFLILCYIINDLGLDKQWLLITESFIFCFSVIFFCKYNANDKFFILLAIILTIFEFTLSGVRQTLAISIFLISYKYACEKKIVIYCLLALLGISFHKSSIIVFVLFFLLYKTINKKILLVYLIVSVISIFFIDSIFSNVSALLNYDQYILMGLEGGYVSFFISLLFCIIILKKYNIEKSNLKFQQATHYTILYTIFSASRFVNAMIMRVLLYVSIYPYLMIDSLKQDQASKKYKKLAIIYLVLYFIYRSKSFDNYLFYWK